MTSGMETVISAVAAVIAGLCMATAGVLQQRAASRRPSGERMSLALIAGLVRDHIWLLGIGAAVLSYAFQAVALTFGPLTLVQPLVVSELLFAVPVSVRLRNLRLRPRDWAACAAIVVGLTVGIVAADPTKGHPIQPITVWAPALGAIALVVAGSLAAARMLQGPVKASMFALAGAVTMGLQSALYDGTIAVVRQDTWRVFASWQAYVLIFASFLGLFLIQNAFESGPLAASTPLIDGVLPLVAIGLGISLFGEQVRTTAWGLTGAGIGILLLVVGIVALDTSPVVRKEQRIEEQEREEAAPEHAAAEEG